MNKRSIIILVLLFIAGQVFAQWPGKAEQSNQLLLPNGWKLSPAGTSIPLGDLPLNMQLSSTGRFLAVTNNGQSTQSVQLIDPRSGKIIDERILVKSWYGLAFTKDEKQLYVSGGNDNWILNFGLKDGKFDKSDTIKLGAVWPKGKIGPAGMVVNRTNTKLYVVTKEDSSVYVINPSKKQVLNKIQLPAIAYSCFLSPDEHKLYVSLWGGKAVAIVNTNTLVIDKLIPVGNHPNELLLNKKGDYLFVANANDNTVSVISTNSNKVIEVISTTLFATQLTGSTTNGLALSDNEKTLYIANADNNCLAVFDVAKPGKSASRGFIPVGWYPTNVKIFGNKILVTNGKGNTSLPNPKGPQPIAKVDNSGYHMGSTANSRLQYIGGLFKGSLSFIPIPKPEELKTYTKQVYANTPFNGERTLLADGEVGNPIPRKLGEKSPIKHVFYIIKENRTYDQVLGDIPSGNGDSSLTLFGKNITPNQHNFAKDYVLLDNFYVDAEVSADGHNWSMAAYATDIVEKTWPTSYGNRGGSTTFEGGRVVTYPKDGFIWDYCQRAGVTYRSYGEFGNYDKANIKSLQGHMGPHSPGFNMDITDQVRVEAWMHDFDSLVVAGAVPQFNTLRISNDHTSGQKIGKVSPQAAVADNDYAVGRFLEHLSHSPIWKESAVFILEDDAQNGPDHVDAHRSPAYVLGPYVKRNTAVHTMYSTSGFLRTMELILGLPPMSQYDAGAMPLFECFTNTPDFTPYTAVKPLINLDTRNIARNESSRRSELFNFAKEDSVPDLELSEVVWKSVKGEESVMPAPKRSAFVILEKKRKVDDDDK
jgi:YVTN family beta-propeller protein